VLESAKIVLCQRTTWQLDSSGNVAKTFLIAGIKRELKIKLGESIAAGVISGISRGSEMAIDRCLRRINGVVACIAD